MFCLCKMYLKCFLVLFIIGSIEGVGTGYSTRASCVFPHLLHGKVRVRQRSRLIKFICLPRYELVGDKYATCRGTEWDVPMPICVRSGCVVPQIENGVQMPSRQNAWVVFFCLPGYKMIGPSTIYCDGLRWNGTAPSCVDATSPTPLKCDFEEPNLCGWKQDYLHDFDWKRLNKRTPSSFLFTGPAYDHTLGKGGSGYFMYIESSSRFINDTARLISPIYDGALAKDGCFVFFYHMFGKTTGGLRVYQKPEKYALSSLLSLRNSEKQKYVLFEKWGNQGDVWYDAVLKLTDFSDDFQILIEGIRGSSFTSDIAIDDVAILQGSNCSVADHDATTPSNYNSESCVGRCTTLKRLSTEQGCSCSMNCMLEDTCCIDYFDVCVFTLDSETYNDENVNSSAEIEAQTQKLISTTLPTNYETTSTTTSTVTWPTTVSTTTRKPTTTTALETNSSSVSVFVVRTQATTPNTTVETTTTTTTTTAKPEIKTTKEDIDKKYQGAIKISTTSPAPKTSKTQKSTITTIKTTKIPKTTSTTLSTDYSRSIDHDVYSDTAKKVRKEHEREGHDENKTQSTEKPKSQSSGLKIGLIILVTVGCCAGLVWLIMEVRSTRGRLALARFRGRAVRDPEVRYLSTDVDDD